MKAPDFVEGDTPPRFHVVINGVRQEGGFETFNKARASVKRQDVLGEATGCKRRNFRPKKASILKTAPGLLSATGRKETTETLKPIRAALNLGGPLQAV